MTFVTDFSSYNSAISVFHTVLDLYSTENLYAFFKIFAHIFAFGFCCCCCLFY